MATRTPARIPVKTPTKPAKSRVEAKPRAEKEEKTKSAKPVVAKKQNDDDALLEKVCLEIAECKTLNQIAKNLDWSIGYFFGWISANSERSARVREARAFAAQIHVENARERLIDAEDPFEVLKAREIAHFEKWFASKIAPKIYGDLSSKAADEVDEAKTITAVEVKFIDAQPIDQGAIKARMESRIKASTHSALTAPDAKAA